MRRNWKSWAGACGGLVLGGCGAVLGQEAAPRVIVIRTGDNDQQVIRLAEPAGDQRAEGDKAPPAAEAAKPSPLWIGVALAPEGLPELLKRHLQLKQGVLVSEVYENSPAAKAGLQPGDILLRAGERELAAAADLIGAVTAAGEKPFAVKYLRDGKEGELKVTPAKRETADVDAQVELAGPGQAPADLEAMLRKLPRMGQLFRNPGVAGADVLIPRPEAIWLHSFSKLPAGVKVQVTKEGDKPAQVRVERDGKSWEVDEKSLDKLPAELRGPVQAMLGGGMGFSPSGEWLSGVVPPGSKGGAQPLPPTARPTPARPFSTPQMFAPSAEAKLDAILKRLDASASEAHEKLEQQLKRLRADLESLEQKVDGKK